MKMGEIIKELRTSKGISQRELANAIGFSQSSIVFWERNQKEPTACAIKKLALFFDTSADYLLGLEK